MAFASREAASHYRRTVSQHRTGGWNVNPPSHPTIIFPVRAFMPLSDARHVSTKVRAFIDFTFAMGLRGARPIISQPGALRSRTDNTVLIPTYQLVP